MTHLGEVLNRTNVVGYSRALNNLGQVAGHGFNAFIADEIAFIWDGQLQFLPTFPGSVLSRAQSLNDLGQVVGEIAFNATNRRATVWEKGMIQDLGGLPEHEVNVAFGINNSGQVVGSSRKLPNPGGVPVLWDKGQVTALPVLPGAVTGLAFHINETGQIVGISGPPANSRAVLWDKGVVNDLGTLGGATSRANAISAGGHIAGHAALANGQSHAVLWRDGSITNLGTLGGTNSTAISLNNLGQVVGNARTAANVQHAFLWESVAIQDLNDLIPAHSGWVLQSAEAINDRSQVSGFGLYNGATRAFLLTPTPELTVERAVIVSWPTNLAGRILEAAPSATGPWTPVDLAPTVTGQQNAVALRTSEAAAIFRLRQP
ncbi:MAG: hypothetical protein L0Z50_29710 [Verrucomicrobiales bacterium]|nr:hypothetical protein [Verrucomicrobiales bacterium]